MLVPGVVIDQPWCRDDTRTLQYGMNEREIRPTEFVGEKSIDIERVCENDSVGFAIIKTERRS